MEYNLSSSISNRNASGHPKFLFFNTKAALSINVILTQQMTAKYNLNIIEQISKIIGERETVPENLLEKCKDITDWNIIVEHQILL